MSRSQINLQDAFLNHVRKEKIPVVINISGGGKIEGLVKGFDNFVILVKHEGQHLIYKHAINSIVPERAVELTGHVTAHAEPEPMANLGVSLAGHEKPAAMKEEGPETTAVPPSENEEPWVEG
jgi:host factor-I protein